MDKNNVSAKEALKMLMDGNKRFVSNTLNHPRTDQARRSMLTEGQAPFAIVLSCADSRVDPNIAFDQGLGDLFVIRVAGNVARHKILGSIEYAVQHLGTKLVFVLGHEKCGAVTASMEPAEVEGHVGAIVEVIKPAVYLARHQDGDLLENAIKNNALMVKEHISDSLPILNRAVKEGGLEVVSGYYKLGSGEVEILDKVADFVA